MAKRIQPVLQSASDPQLCFEQTRIVLASPEAQHRLHFCDVNVEVHTKRHNSCFLLLPARLQPEENTVEVGAAGCVTSYIEPRQLLRSRSHTSVTDPGIAVPLRLPATQAAGPSQSVRCPPVSLREGMPLKNLTCSPQPSRNHLRSGTPAARCASKSR